MEKIILNPTTNVQNVVNRAELTKVIKMTLQQLGGQLLDVSGPFARNAFILNNTDSIMSGMNATVVNAKLGERKQFTRDGIKTIEAIEYASPIQRYIKDEVLVWIGRRIDAVCRDGTTTAMLFTASFLVYLLESADSLVSMYPIVDIEQAFDEVSQDVLNSMNQYKITCDDLKKNLEKVFKAEGHVLTDEHVRILMARMQADTSSAGRKDVSESIAAVVAHTPITGRELNINYRIPTVETKEVGISASMDEYDFAFRSTLYSTTALNHDHNRAYKGEHVDILVLQHALVRDSMLAIGLQNYICDLAAQKVKRDILLIMPSMQNNRADIDYLDRFTTVAKEKGVQLICVFAERPFGYNAPDERWYFLDALCAKAEVKSPEERLLDIEYATVEPFIIKDAEVLVTFVGTQIKNIVNWDLLPEENRSQIKEDLVSRNIHPGEVYPDQYPIYTGCKQYFHELIEALQAEVKTNYATVIADIERGISTLTMLHYWYIDINGKQHDVEMYKLIIEDAAGGAMIALKDGVFFNGPIKLFKTLSELTIRNPYNNDPIKSFILIAMLRASLDIACAIFGNRIWKINNPATVLLSAAGEKYSYLNVARDISFVPQLPTLPLSYLKDMDPPTMSLMVNPVNQEEPALVTYARQILFPDTVEYGDRPMATPPCQVGNLFEVLFHRLREVTLRLVLTDNIVAPNTMWDDGSLNRKK